MKETRTITMSVRAEQRGDDDAPELVGYAARFDDVTTISGLFDEVIRRGAFADTIKDKDDVRALHNHDENQILGRTTSGTLKLEEDDTGLRVVINPPDTQQARDLMVSIERGDIDQMSFGFSVVEERWNSSEEEERELRELIKVRLFDVSTVTFPAYTSTSIGIRSAEEVMKQHLASAEDHQIEAEADNTEEAHEGAHLSRLVEIEDSLL
jgi:HK97 family phage prohead protease